MIPWEQTNVDLGNVGVVDHHLAALGHDLYSLLFAVHLASEF
jgi:hypothetical protein